MSTPRRRKAKKKDLDPSQASASAIASGEADGLPQPSSSGDADEQPQLLGQIEPGDGDGGEDVRTEVPQRSAAHLPEFPARPAAEPPGAFVDRDPKPVFPRPPPVPRAAAARREPFSAPSAALPQLLLAPLRLLALSLAHALSPLSTLFSTFLLLLLILLPTYYFLLHPYLSLFSLPSLPSLPHLDLDLGVTDAWCAHVGWGCPAQQLDVASVAHSLGNHAAQAHDIFQSIVALGEPGALGLHHTEIWELAIAVRASSTIPDRDILGAQLMDLGDLSRDVKDRIIGINSEGLNAFSFIILEFQRLAHLLSTSPDSPAIHALLSTLITHLSQHLTSLQHSIESALPLSDRASRLAGQTLESLAHTSSSLAHQHARTPLLARLLASGSSALLGSGAPEHALLARDISLAHSTAGTLVRVRRELEDTRSALVAYRDQAGWFRASVVGFHLADHGLDPEVEVRALEGIVGAMREAVEDAKAVGRGMGGRGARRGAIEGGRVV